MKNVIIFLSLWLVVLALGSCNKSSKCHRVGNGKLINIDLYSPLGIRYTSDLLEQIKFYYFQKGGTADTLISNPTSSKDRSISTYRVRIDYEEDFLSIHNLTTETLNGNVKDGNLYLLFPDGHTDSLKVMVRNEGDCKISSGNYHIDGLLYNGTEAAFLYKIPLKKLGGPNHFKVVME